MTDDRKDSIRATIEMLDQDIAELQPLSPLQWSRPRRNRREKSSRRRRVARPGGQRRARTRLQ